MVLFDQFIMVSPDSRGEEHLLQVEEWGLKFDHSHEVPLLIDLVWAGSWMQVGKHGRDFVVERHIRKGLEDLAIVLNDELVEEDAHLEVLLSPWIVKKVDSDIDGETRVGRLLAT